ncbi:Uncharacterised protein [Alysiella crassa]|uniref:Lipoprotein n=1 Tax=Alysiella crassa TaxID=153491 RepID=A0A376BLU8_9NEIS|nr:Uncharacterised protein [Alysiella crassa]
MKKVLRYAALAACLAGLSACYIVQPAPNSQIVIQNPNH